jgi:hypothetical protein
MPVALLVLLWAGLTCAYEPRADEVSALTSARELLASACERALAGLAPDAEPGPFAPASLPAEVGPALRALRATGMGGRVAALEAAVERAARLALADVRPDLERAVAGFAPENADALVSGEGDALSVAFRAAAEADLRARLAAAAEQRLEDAGAPAALEGVRNGAARLPLPRKVDLDLVSVVTDQALESFFIALSEAERQLRRERVALHNE